MMTMASYIALMRKDGGSDFGVDFPDFPGCVTAGRSLEEARRAAAEALALHIEGMNEDGEPVPDASRLDAVMADPHNSDAVGFLVDLPQKATRSVRVNVMLPQDVLDGIDRITTNRSRFLADAARDKLRAD
jgi:predicted RNase H-like HicB family nuclease